MKQGIILLLAVLALTAAMIPRDRRAVNTEEEEELLMSENAATTTDTPQEICPPQTPCGWTVYKSNSKIIETILTNNYCVCSNDTNCQIIEDDSTVSAYVHRCRPPSFKSDLES